MPITLNHFIEKFTSGDAVDPQQASQYFERFASNRPEDREFDNQALQYSAAEYLAQLPENQFQQAAQNAFSQAAPTQQQTLLSSLIEGLRQRGVDIPAVGDQLGLRSTNPQHMGAPDYARLATYAREHHSAVMLEHVQSQPWLVKAMGNHVLVGSLGMVAAKMTKRG